ncbi:outer membrane beta-barrel protein [Halalkalibaculum sp. DA384]|uniref:porin family protein n=1 Tax=Halalkalibaculum sp. DA384 TaxID=3373606 RepID=UPI003753F454
MISSSIIKKSILSISILLIASTVAFSQHYSNNEYRRLSLSVSGGASLGDMNQGNYFMSSNFSVNTKDTPAFGLGVQYALTPAWSLELGYRHTQVKGRAIPFTSSVNLFTLKNFVNLNQLLFVNRISNRVNPFLTAGIGYDVVNYDGPDAAYDLHNASYNAGAGVAYRLTNTVDLFSQYEYHIGSNSIDNDDEGFGTDLINTLTFGVRINFGKKDAKLASWRDVPVDISPSEYDRFMTQSNLISNLEQRVEQVEKRDTDNEKLLTELKNEKEAEIDSLKNHISRLNERLSNLKMAFSELQDKTINGVEVDTATGLTESLPRGHYVQIFATQNLDIARDMREHTLQQLNGVIEQAEEKIFIIHRKEFYEVMIGLFKEFSHASDVQEVLKPIHEDAYVISFPRPLSLKTDFEGLEVINTNKAEITVFNN